MKHSPGPWKIEHGAEVFDKNGNGVCVPYTISDHDIANANLIVSAPEMFKELERIVELNKSTILLVTEDIEPIQKLLNKIKGVRK